MIGLISDPVVAELVRLCIYMALIDKRLNINPTSFCLHEAHVNDILDLVECEETIGKAVKICETAIKRVHQHGSDIVNVRVEVYCFCCSEDKPLVSATLRNIEKWRSWAWAYYIALTHIKHRHGYGAECPITISVIEE